MHEKFLRALNDAVAPHSKCKLSKVFFDFRESFLIYGEYCAKMTNAAETLKNKCNENADVQRCMEQSQKEYDDGRKNLRDILTVPMQRILRYRLLLDRLVKKTAPVSSMEAHFQNG